MASVVVTGIEKSFGAEPVLRDVSIEVRDGEFLVLVGPSGCGKSTLLRLIAGLETNQKGTIAIDGRSVDRLQPRDRDIAMVFQNYALYPHMNVRDNMAFALKLRRQSRGERERAVQQAAEILGLVPYLDRFPRELSGGQRQRVAMGRAIVRNPRLFLFDEPLSNLDAKLRVQMRVEIKELHRRLGTTSIYVTHDQFEAMTMADRIVVLNAGRIAQIGTPLTLYDTPANLFVAGFIGSPNMNFFPAVVRRGEGGAHAVTDDGTALPLPPETPLGEGRAIVYGVRPEHVGIAPAGGIAARVHVVEQTGPETHVHVEVAGVKASLLVAERPPVRPGDTLSVAPRLDRLHAFDGETGARLAV